MFSSVVRLLTIVLSFADKAFSYWQRNKDKEEAIKAHEYDKQVTLNEQIVSSNRIYSDNVERLRDKAKAAKR